MTLMMRKYSASSCDLTQQLSLSRLHLEKSAYAWDCSTHQHVVTRQLSLSLVYDVL
jgi:hypothetical protein